MESPQKSAVSPSMRLPNSTEWLTGSEKDKLRQSSKDFQAYIRNSPQFHRWQKNFQRMKGGCKWVCHILFLSTFLWEGNHASLWSKITTHDLQYLILMISSLYFLFMILKCSLESLSLYFRLFQWFIDIPLHFFPTNIMSICPQSDNYQIIQNWRKCC